MADPNTQIDWWIAQAWQEAQGGADSDALVAWLHENGLTSISSYTILQAALSCPPDEAKKMVFGHPVWAGEDSDPDIADLDYTSETLEPEPEPDPAFELDDWAEQVEEDGPVYGEEGYRPGPVADAETEATAIEPAGPGDFAEDTAPPEPLTAFDGADQPGEANSLDAVSVEPDPGFVLERHASAPVPEGLAEPMDVLAPAGNAAPAEPDPGFVLEGHTAPATGDLSEPADTIAPAAQVLSPEPIMPAPASLEPPLVPETGPAVQPAPMPDAPGAPVEAIQPAAAPAPPPVLKTPPPTPAERAAVFAGAFGKKPVAKPPETASSVPAASVPAMEHAGPALDTPDAVEIQMPAPAVAPLVYEPIPQIEMPQPVAQAEPLFAAPRRDPQPLPPLFPPAREQPPETVAADVQGNAASDNTGAPPPDAGVEQPPATDDADSRSEPEPAAAPNGLDAAAAPEPAMSGQEVEMQFAPASEEDAGDPLAAMMQEAPGQLDEPMDVDNHEEGRPSGIDREQEQELPPPGEEEEGAAYAALGNAGDSGAACEEEDPAEAHHPRKRALLEPSAEAGEAGLPGGGPVGIPIGDTPEEMAAAAKMLGIDFRGVDPANVGTDQETAKAAKELGISFREESSADELALDETALEAQKLGISFRDGDSTSGSSEKPLVVKYLPMFLGIIAIFFLLLIGATFAGPFIGWLKG